MLMKTDDPKKVGTHVFEAAGLGKAPFRCVGVVEVTYQACPGAPIQPGGSCDYCGTGISIHCKIKSADGKEFKVGSDCVRKTGDAGLLRGYQTHPAVRKMAADKRKAKDAKIVAEWTALIEAPATVEKLSKMFVAGRPWVAGEQITLLEHLKTVWGMCGAAGRARWFKKLKGYVAMEVK